MVDRFVEDLVALLPRLRRFALTLARQADVADDLVQVTAERALAGRDRFDPETRLDAWLFRILHNAWIDTVRRRQTRGTEVDIADTPEARIVDGEKVAETALMLKSAEAAIAALPEDQRAVMLLVCVEELSYREAAETLNVPVGTVMSRLARARLAVAQSMGIKPAVER